MHRGASGEKRRREEQAGRLLHCSSPGMQWQRIVDHRPQKWNVEAMSDAARV
jgi:hypothetical protein